MRSRLDVRRALALVAVLILATGGAVADPSRHPSAAASVIRVGSSVVGSDGVRHSVTNHLVRTRTRTNRHTRREYVLAWAGAADPGTEGSPNPDFLAVIDATAGTPDYGKVVNTVTIDNSTGNEPHHMQYMWHKGQKIYAGGILSDTVFVFDATRLPQIGLSGVVQASDTPCGSAPDAFQVLSDGTAYMSAVGGPDVTGPCRYSGGQVREGNGFAGSPGEIVRIGPNGKVLSEAPAATKEGEDPKLCPNVPALPQPTCANPHGLQVREDLNRLITSDFVELRTPIVDNPNLARDTVRIFDISDRNAPRLLSVSRLPAGPRHDADLNTAEPRGAMETGVTHQPRHRGAFVATSGGGVIYYTPDITAKKPRWREVFDDATAFKSLFPKDTPTSDGDAGSWVQVSPDDRFLFHVVVSGGYTSPGERETGMLYVLDLRRLLAAGDRTRCSIDSPAEVTAGGAEPDCPSLIGAVPIRDVTSGGAHWGSLDNFALGRDGFYHETAQIRRVVTSNYFVAFTGVDGNHQICVSQVSPSGKPSLDTGFVDENTHAPCVEFNRDKWPHGDHGPARPHGVVFAVADADLR